MRLHNMFKMGLGTLTARIYKKRFPLNVMFSVTNRCPSHCKYCNIPERKQRELTTQEVFILIDQVCEMGCQRIGLWGGEPLMRADISEIIDYSKAKGLFVTLDSNGYLVAKEVKLLSKLDHLILALDGPQQAHDLNRGLGSFRKVMSAIEAAAGKLPLWTITVLTKHNLNSIDFILDNARKYGFLATFQLLHHNDRLSRNHESLLPPSEDYKKAIREIIGAKKKGAPIASSFNYLSHILNWPDYKMPTSAYKIGNCDCWAGKLYCNIDTDGSVYPCSLLVDKVDALNFLEVGFKKTFESLRSDFCKSCLASCFTEYNYIFSLNAATIIEWLKSMQRTSEHTCEMAN